MMSKTGSALALAGLSGLMLAEAAYAGPPRLTFPVACELGRTCVLQNHVDLDPSPDAKDFACGTLTYDGHNGTDIRVPTLEAQRAGVEVLAAASGRVARVRDGVPDLSVRARGLEAVRGAECGNGLAIDHGEGWETQYCHMAQGSVRVRPGDSVRAGQPLGIVGMSGQTEYPHLHFVVRHERRVVDPFAFGAAPGTFGAGEALWGGSARIAYTPGAVLNRGFAAGPVTMEAIESGEASRATPDPGSPALVAYIRVIGLKQGDFQHLVVRGPEGKMLAENRGEALDRSKAQYMLFAGARRPASGWQAGSYEASYTLVRDGKTILEDRFELKL